MGMMYHRYRRRGGLALLLVTALVLCGTGTAGAWFPNPSPTYYLDADGDGYGDKKWMDTYDWSYGRDHKVTQDGDCDDTNASIHPGASEICGNSVDEDCDGTVEACAGDDGSGSDSGDSSDDSSDSGDSGDSGDSSDDTDDACIDLADTPLATQLDASAPNLMLGLDDSGSMDWEMMTSESNGLFVGGGTTYAYVFANTGDHLYASGTYSNCQEGSSGGRYWYSQWSEYNVIYYDPDQTYDPWTGMDEADTDNPLSNPCYEGASCSNYSISLSGDFTTIGSVTIPNAHYYIWSYTDDTPYLITLDGSITYYKVNTTDETVDSGELVQTASPPDDVQTDLTYAEARQNFANWYTYYRKRRLTAVAAIGSVIPELEGVNVGIRNISGKLIQSVLPVSVDGEDQTDDLLSSLFSYVPPTNYGTPLRVGLKRIGQYFNKSETCPDSALSTSPLSDEDGGACQQNFTLMFTDGAYDSGESVGLGNVDNTSYTHYSPSDPYRDSVSDTLADVAMYYWLTDLNPDISDEVPTTAKDTAYWQHMVTYTVSFGLEGNLNQDDYDLYNANESLRVYPTWPSAITSTDDRIDDLWHAAVNGRGSYLSAKTPSQLVDAFESVVDSILDSAGSGASVAANGEELQEGLLLFQATYSSSRWTGDLVAYNVDSTTGEVGDQEWSAADVLDEAMDNNTAYWNTGRLIATYDPTASAGIPFRYDDLNEDQQAVVTSTEMVAYLRGCHDLEERNGGDYRSRYLTDDDGTYKRDTALGDVVHSAPYYYDSMIYVGGNDGMLHAYESESGKELFAYIPSFVVDNLADLTDPDYTHQYFVDLTPYARNTGTQDLLVGGLGKGGKGYFCLDITDASDGMSDEDALAGKVMWEFPNAATSDDDADDLGYSFSKAFVVNSRAGWVVIFGNGYDSTGGDAVLFIVDAATGALVKKISAGTTAGCNGLSTPLAVDIVSPDADDASLMVSGSDGLVDYVYAGDLKGNLWKFDLTDASSDNWAVAYNDGTDNQPLFQALDDDGTPQPITTQPDAMYHCDSSYEGLMVYFGTGKYLGKTDISTTDLQTLYAVWDYGDDSDDDEYLGAFQRGEANVLSNQPDTVSLLEQEVYWSGTVDGTEYRIMTDNSLTWGTEEDTDTGADGDLENPNPSGETENHVGWYFDLPDSGERIVRDVEIRGGKVIVITSIPENDDPCTSGGESWVMELDACDGSRTSDAELDVDGDGDIDADDLISILSSDGTSSSFSVSGIKYSSMLYNAMIEDDTSDSTELKYFSDSSGNIITLTEEDEGSGMTYWRQREN